LPDGCYYWALQTDRKGKIHDDIFKELEEIAMKDKNLRTAFQSWGEMSDTQKEALAYEARMKKVLDEGAAVREAELREARAWELGREKVRKEIARRLLANKTDVKTVAEVTDLPEERVLEIQKEMGE
jgi:predicted transposase/invertase (TIGR01784 family)